MITTVRLVNASLTSCTFIFIYLFLAALIFVAVPAFSSCGEQGLLFIAVRGLLIAVDSLVVEHEL